MIPLQTRQAHFEPDYAEAIANALTAAQEGGCECRPEVIVDLRRGVNELRLLHESWCPRLASLRASLN